MKCAKSGCDADAQAGSNYCGAHQPSSDRYEYKKAEEEKERRRREKKDQN